jgi:hypothetical protein
MFTLEIKAGPSRSFTPMRRMPANCSTTRISRRICRRWRATESRSGNGKDKLIIRPASEADIAAADGNADDEDDEDDDEEDGELMVVFIVPLDDDEDDDEAEA